MDTYINHIQYYLPDDTLSNADIERAHPEWTIEKISSKTGILNRHIAAKDEFVSDMAVKACEKLFSEFRTIEKESIDYLILCTQSADYHLPTTACVIQDRLGLKQSIGAIDVNQGCSGFIYCLGLAKGLIESGQATNVLVVTADTYSKYIHYLDKGNKTLFGDAAAATLLSNENIGLSCKLNQFVYGTDGGGFESLIVKNGGSRYKNIQDMDIFEENNFVKNDNNLFMDGRAVFQFTNSVVPKLVQNILQKNKQELNGIDKFVFHQANKFMLNKIVQKLNIPENKFVFNSQNIGNTVSSTIPISLKNLFEEHNPEKGNNLLIAGFGVGLSYGGTILSIN